MQQSADAFYDPMRNVNTVEKWVSVLIYRDYNYRGIKYRFNSISIDMDKDALRTIIADKVSMIDIYFDPKDPSNHYFDLNFLC